MNTRGGLLASIAGTIADYRSLNIAFDEEHVDNWVNQFPAASQLPILTELNHVLPKTYFSKKKIVDFMGTVLNTQKLTGADPVAFWKGIAFLDIQGAGGSQREMLALFDAQLKLSHGFGVRDCGTPPTAYVYLDDAIFTGNRVRRDLEQWIAQSAPASAKLHVINVAQHRGGWFYAQQKIREAAKAAGKSIETTWWRAIELEDRKTSTNTSDVLRPTSIPPDADVQAYVDAMRYKPHLRVAGQVGEHALFSSDAGRQTLEQEFLTAGVKIRRMAPNLGDTQRPLGHMTLETLGFGSLIVTFRNCPNNAPLALWAGDPWYPLFPRTTNSDTSFARFLAGLRT